MAKPNCTKLVSEIINPSTFVFSKDGKFSKILASDLSPNHPIYDELSVSDIIKIGYRRGHNDGYSEARELNASILNMRDSEKESILKLLASQSGTQQQDGACHFSAEDTGDQAGVVESEQSDINESKTAPTVSRTFLEQPQIKKTLPEHQVNFEISEMTNFLDRVLAAIIDGSVDKVVPGIAVLLDQLVEIPEYHSGVTRQSIYVRSSYETNPIIYIESGTSIHLQNTNLPKPSTTNTNANNLLSSLTQVHSC